MSTQPTGGEGFHLEDGLPILDSQLDKIEREQAEAKVRDERYKDEQLELNRQQLKVNRRLMWFTGLLALTSIVAGAITLYQAHISKISAEAARAAVEVARDSLTETALDNERHTKLTEQARISSERDSNDSLKATIDALHYDQRAWVGFSNTPMTPNSATKSGWESLISNTGKTPARNVVASVGFYARQGPYQPSAVEDKWMTRIASWAASRGPTVTYNEFLSSAIENPHDGRIYIYNPSLVPAHIVGTIQIPIVANFNTLRPGTSEPFIGENDSFSAPITNSTLKVTFVFFGTITYTDVFAIKRRTIFCLTNQDAANNNSYRKCPVHNDME